MPSKGAPASDLKCIELWHPSAHPVATVPLKPATFIRISVGISEQSMIVIIGTPSPTFGRRPGILFPHRERLTCLNTKEVASCRIRTFWGEAIVMKARQKPLDWKFGSAVIHIFAFEGTEHQNLCGTQIWLKISR
jgi:hypothetical protein